MLNQHRCNYKERISFVNKQYFQKFQFINLLSEKSIIIEKLKILTFLQTTTNLLMFL